jgi:hypothetical protein
MAEIKIIIDFDENPMEEPGAKQVIYVNGVYEPIDYKNIIGKYITDVSLHEDTNCLLLTLNEELPKIEGESVEEN